MNPLSSTILAERLRMIPPLGFQGPNQLQNSVVVEVDIPDLVTDGEIINPHPRRSSLYGHLLGIYRTELTRNARTCVIVVRLLKPEEFRQIGLAARSEDLQRHPREVRLAKEIAHPQFGLSEEYEGASEVLAFDQKDGEVESSWPSRNLLGRDRMNVKLTDSISSPILEPVVGRGFVSPFLDDRHQLLLEQVAGPCDGGFHLLRQHLSYPVHVVSTAV